MNKSIFFLYYRAGSTLFECLCGKEWRILQANGNLDLATKSHQEWRLSGKSFYLPTLPQIPCEDISRPIQEVCKQHDSFSYHVHVGDWWGNLHSSKIPEPLDGHISSRWGPDELNSFPDFRFVALMRDGRNQIESLRRMNGIERKMHERDPREYFTVLCKGYRNRARIALENLSRFRDRYCIFKFEDFVRKPIVTMSAMFAYAGLQLDVGRVRKIASTHKLITNTNHSSFSNVNFNERWHSWSTWEKKTFYDIAGKELMELGYE